MACHTVGRCVADLFFRYVSIALACVGSCRQDIADKLLPYIADETTSMEIAANAALALGMVFVGSANGDIAITIVQSLMERLESTLSDKWARFIALALGLVYLGKCWSHAGGSHLAHDVYREQVDKRHLRLPSNCSRRSSTLSASKRRSWSTCAHTPQLETS